MKRNENRAPRKRGVLSRAIGDMFRFYPKMTTFVVVAIMFNAVVATLPAIFMQQVIETVTNSYKSGDWASVSGKILTLVLILAGIYLVSLTLNHIYHQMMAVMTQGYLDKQRQDQSVG